MVKGTEKPHSATQEQGIILSELARFESNPTHYVEKNPERTKLLLKIAISSQDTLARMLDIAYNTFEDGEAYEYIGFDNNAKHGYIEDMLNTISTVLTELPTVDEAEDLNNGLDEMFNLLTSAHDISEVDKFMNLPYPVGEDEVNEPRLAVYYILEDLVNQYFSITPERSATLADGLTYIFKKYMGVTPEVAQSKKVTEAAIQWAILDYLNMAVQVEEDINPYQKEVHDTILSNLTYGLDRIKINIHSDWFKTL